MTATTVHLCVFTTGLDELPRRKQRDMQIVARHLHEAGKFSVFEATANQDIARTMDKLISSGWIETDNSPGYPWTLVTLTDVGRRAIGLALPKGET